MSRLPHAVSLLLSLIPFVAGIAFAAEPVVQERGTMEYHNQKVVYHLNDVQVAEPVLKNVQNHINSVGAEKLELAVVVHGKGIDFLLDEWKDAEGKSHGDTVRALTAQGVKFMICGNTLRGRNIGREKVNPAAMIVPSGVATLAELQMRGYAYIKP